MSFKPKKFGILCPGLEEELWAVKTQKLAEFSINNFRAESCPHRTTPYSGVDVTIFFACEGI